MPSVKAAFAPPVAAPDVIPKTTIGGHKHAEKEDEHEMEGDLVKKCITGSTGQPRDILVAERDVDAFDLRTSATSSWLDEVAMSLGRTTYWSFASDVLLALCSDS